MVGALLVFASGAVACFMATKKPLSEEPIVLPSLNQKTIAPAPEAVKTTKPPLENELIVSSIPYQESFTLTPGAFRILRLPNGKTVAVWCKKLRGMSAILENGDLGFEYGEEPFKNLKSEEIRLPKGGMTYGDYLSYIQSGGARDDGKRGEYTLYVMPYTLTLIREGATEKVLPMTITVCEMTDEEKRERKIPRREMRQHYLDALKSNDPTERIEAIRWIGRMTTDGFVYAGDPAENRKAIRPLLKDVEFSVREEALKWLRALGDEELLLEMFSPENEDHLRQFGGRGFADMCKQGDTARVEKKVLSFLEKDDAWSQTFALEFFFWHSGSRSQVKPYLAKCLKSDTATVRIATVAVIRFACERKEAAKLIESALDDPDEDVLKPALYEASAFTDIIPVTRILPFMTHKKPEIRKLAVNALDCSQKPEAIDPLLTMSRDASPEVRAEAAVILGRVGNPKVYDRLIELLGDLDAKVRESAINGLRWLGDKRAIPAIQKLKEDKEECVRDMAARTIRELSNK